MNATLMHSATMQENVDLQERVKAALGLLGYCCLDDLEVVARGGHVVLKGRVPIYDLVRFAESVAQAEPGCHSVENLIEVASTPAPKPGGGWYDPALN